MVVVGADVHKRTHTFVAVDEVGRKLGEKTVKADPKGHDEAISWARERFGAELLWAIEDCRHLSARLERDLLDAGRAGGAGAAEADGSAASHRPDPRASPTRSTRWRWRGPRCASPTCRSRPTTRRRGS